MKKTKQAIRYLKKGLRYLLIALISLISVVLVYLGFAYTLSFWGTSPTKMDCAEDDFVYLSSNGVHIDLIIPVERLEEDLLEQMQLMDGAKYVAIGWGDRGFYLNTPSWEDLQYSTVAKALLWWSPSVMHVSYYRGTSSNWTKVPICQEQIDLMSDQFAKSFKTNKDGTFQKIEGYAYGQNDYFFEAKGSYHLFRTCNVWTGQVLKKGNIKTSLWSPFTWGIMHHAEQLEP
jgi:uncharacterized protein (TIGR02117 family)